MNVNHAKHWFRRDGKQVKDDYDNLKAEAKVLNQIIERLQGVEGNNSQLQSDAERLLRQLFRNSLYRAWLKIESG